MKIIHFVQRYTVWIILAVGLVNGLFYLLALPPWQHYDEPGHFEYAWLIANRLKLPQPSDYDQSMRVAVGKSLLDSHFFEIANLPLPNLTDPTQPIWIGFQQLSDPPFYYILAAIPLFVLRSAPINIQLYAGRFVSLLFFLAVIYAAYELAKELFPKGHAIRWALPLFLALLPAFAEFMTAMNNFTAAIGLLSIWLVVSIKLIKHGFNLKSGILLIGFSIACFFTQKAVWVAVILLPIVLLLSFLPPRYKVFGWVLSFLVILVSGVLLINMGDAAYWLRANNQSISPRTTVTDEGQIQNALQGEIFPDSNWGSGDPGANTGFFQLVPSNVGDALKGKTVTIGAWIWADQVVHGYGPGVNSLYQYQDQWSGFKPVTLSTTPVFVASVIQLPQNQDRLQIWLRTTSPDQKNAHIYFSGVVLAEGDRPTDTAPVIIGQVGNQGTWGSEPYTNLVRNSQFQQPWPFLKPAVMSLVSSKMPGLYPMQVSSIFSVFLDYKGTSWYITSTSGRIFRTFWLSFAWGTQVNGDNIVHRPYLILLILTILGIGGSLLEVPRLVKHNLNEFILMVVVSTMVIIMAYLYGVYTMGGALRYRAYLPVARYIFPAIILLGGGLVLGWQGLLTFGMRHIKFPHILGPIVFITMMVVIDIYLAANMLAFFHPPSG